MRAALAALAAATAALAAWRFARERAWEDPQRLWMALYIAPIYVLAFAWAAVAAGQRRFLRPRGLAVDAVVVGLARSRGIVPIFPGSGHVLFLLYTVLVTRSLAYRLAAIAFLAVSLAMKLVLWHDVVTPLVGAAAAVALWRLSGRSRRTAW